MPDAGCLMPGGLHSFFYSYRCFLLLRCKRKMCIYRYRKPIVKTLELGSKISVNLEVSEPENLFALHGRRFTKR